MSLVNNMLRDLDQRRRESDSATGSMKLMPAADIPIEKKGRVLLYVLGGLIVAAGGLTWLWFESAGGEDTRPLNIRPAVVDRGPVSAERESAVFADTDNASPARVAQAERSSPAEGDSTAASQTTTQSDNPVAQTGPGASAVARQSESSQPPRDATATAVPVSPRSAPPEVSPVQASNHEAPSSVAAGAAPAIVESLPPLEPEQLAASAGTGVTPSRNITAGTLADPVKNNAEMSPEALDTMAVQVALHLIADNRVTEAYSHLEQHIMNNRYAHQSRETYAKLLMNQGELLASYNLVESGLGLAPNHAGYKKVKARILISEGRITEAVDLLSRRAPPVSSDLEYHEILATAQLASRDYSGARASYTSLVQQDRSRGKWWYGYAAAQDSLGNRTAAYQAYNQALQQGNLSPNLRSRSQARLAALSQ